MKRKKKKFMYTTLRCINIGQLGKLLEDHLDQELVKYLLDGYNNGFMLGCTQHPEPREPCQNLHEAIHNPEITQELIDKEVALGHMLGLFEEQMIENMIFSPINIVPKPGTKKCRLINDLAYPYNSESMNSYIPKENLSVQYHHIDEVINMELTIGVCARGARCDNEMAFYHQSMHFSQLFLLGFIFQGKFYINSSLPFSATCRCAIFKKVASALQWIITNEIVWTLISHFLDDFPLLGSSNEDVALFIAEFYRIME